MNMREKIAQVLYDAHDWDVIPERVRGKWFSKADAVLDALMEPDWEMMQSGADASPMWDTRNSEVYAIAVNDVADIFRAMIQAARDGK